MPTGRLHIRQDPGIRNVFERVTTSALKAGMLACAGESCHGMIKGLFVERREETIFALMLFMTGNTLLRRHLEMISSLCLDGSLDVGMARKALGAGYHFRSLVALGAVVQAAQMLMCGR